MLKISMYCLTCTILYMIFLLLFHCSSRGLQKEEEKIVPGFLFFKRLHLIRNEVLCIYQIQVTKVITLEFTGFCFVGWVFFPFFLLFLLVLHKIHTHLGRLCITGCIKCARYRAPTQRNTLTNTQGKLWQMAKQKLYCLLSTAQPLLIKSAFSTVLLLTCKFRGIWKKKIRVPSELLSCKN